jgi:hypothetical protein
MWLRGINQLQRVLGWPTACLKASMRKLIVVLMALMLATACFAQSRGGRSFGGGGRGFAGGGFGRGFGGGYRGYGGYGYGRFYGGYGLGFGLGFAPFYGAGYWPGYYAPYYAPYRYPAYPYYAPPVGPVVVGPSVVIGGGWRRFGR